MAQTVDMEAIRNLSVSERLALIDMIWQTIAPRDLPPPTFSDETKVEVRRRIQELKDDPDAGLDIDQARAWLRARRKA